MNVRSALFAAAAAALLATGCATSAQQGTDRTPVTETVMRLPASGDRALEMRIWAAPNPSAVVVFSAGGGGEPRNYGRLVRALAQAGYTVIAPVHRDALARGDLSGSGGPDSFASRVEDLAIARGYAKQAHPGVPLVAMGHSFGSMMSALAIGATTPAGPQTDPAVKALVAFSSPGLIPGLLSPASYATLTAPVLSITGNADVVQGFVTDWRSHRALHDANPTAGSMLVVAHDATHNLVAEADEAKFRQLVDLTLSFIRANALGDAAERANLARVQVDWADIERR